MPKHVSDYLVYLLVRLVVCALQILSPRGCEQFAKGTAWLCYDVFGLRKKVIEENLRASFPDYTDEQIQSTGRGMWKHLFLLAAEIAQAGRKVHDTNWLDYITVKRKPDLVEQLLSDRPTVILSGHFGNFELAGYILSLFGFDTYTVARTLDNPYLDKYLNNFRSAKGQHILPKMGSAAMIDQLLANGDLLTVLGDQHAGQKGCWVNFFGRPASTNKGPAVFALTNQAPIVVCVDRRLDKFLLHEVRIVNVLDPAILPEEQQTIPFVTQWFTDQLESGIRRAPEQYWWVHRRWKGTPPVKKTSAS
jgi:KDO2-lipid IV(A) lauroyltransferase